MTRPRAPRLRNATDAESLSLLVARARGTRTLGDRRADAPWVDPRRGPNRPWASA